MTRGDNVLLQLSIDLMLNIPMYMYRIYIWINIYYMHFDTRDSAAVAGSGEGREGKVLNAFV